MGDVDAFQLSPFKNDSDNKKDDKMSARIIMYMRVLLVVLIIAVIGVICLLIVHSNHANETKKELSSMNKRLDTLQQAGNSKTAPLQTFPQTIPIFKQKNITDNTKSNVSRPVPSIYDEAIFNLLLQQNTAFEHFIKGFDLMEQNITTLFKTELMRLKSHIAEYQPTSNTYELNETRISLDALVNSVTSLENGVRQLDSMHNSTLHSLSEYLSSYASDVTMNIKTAAESILENITNVEERVQDVANTLAKLTSALPKLNQSMFSIHTDRLNENAEIIKYLQNINASVHETDQMLMQSPISKDLNAMRDVFETELKNIGAGQVNMSGGVTSISTIVESALIAILSQNETLKKVDTDVTLRFDELSEFNAVFKKTLMQLNDSLFVIKEEETIHFEDSEDLLKTLFSDINSTLEIQTFKLDQNVLAIQEGVLYIAKNSTAVSQNSESNLASLITEVKDHSDVNLENMKALLNDSNSEKRLLKANDEQFINDLQNRRTNVSKMIDSITDRQIEMISLLKNHSKLNQDASSDERLSLSNILNSLKNISDTIKANPATEVEQTVVSSSGLVRLNAVVVMSATSLGGRVEVFNDAAWGTVCDDDFGTSDATVVCRMLGYTRGVAKSGAFYGQSGIRMWLDDVGCSGSESSIFDCRHSGLGVDNCGASEEVGVICS